MTSELKSATARANGAKSRGPKSPETREKSSQNSLKHGFTARNTIVLECECDDDFEEMLADYAAAYQPGSPVEQSLVEEMAAARWRILRLRMIETALLDSEMNRELPPGETQPEPTDPGYQIAAAFRRLADQSRALSLASRYESRLHRIHERSHRTLRELQQSGKQQASEPVPPPPVQPEAPPPQAKEDCGAAPGAAQSPNPQPIAESKNRETNPSPRKQVHCRAALRHRGIMSYIGANNFRCFQQFKAA